MLVSLIAVTCQSVFVVIVGTLVDVHLEVYAVCAVNLSCFLYTCASVAMAVQVFVASVVLLGTIGEVENVLVQAIVWSPLVFTQSAVLGIAHPSARV